MDITFTCNSCNQELSIDETGAGQNITCPQCHAAQLVPDKTSTSELKQTIRLMPFSTPATRSTPAASSAPAVAAPSPAAPPTAPPPGTEAARPMHSAPSYRSSSPAMYRSSPATSALASTPPPTQAVRAVVTDVDMSISSMMGITLKWAIAALPAFSLLFFVGVLLWKLLRWLLKI